MKRAITVAREASAQGAVDPSVLENLAAPLLDVERCLDRAHALALASGRCDTATRQKFADIDERLERMLAAVRFRAA